MCNGVDFIQSRSVWKSKVTENLVVVREIKDGQVIYVGWRIPVPNRMPVEMWDTHFEFVGNRCVLPGKF